MKNYLILCVGKNYAPFPPPQPRRDTLYELLREVLDGRDVVAVLAEPVDEDPDGREQLELLHWLGVPTAYVGVHPDGVAAEVVVEGYGPVAEEALLLRLRRELE